MPASHVAQGGAFKKIKAMHRYSTSEGWKKVKAAWRYTSGAWAKVYNSGYTTAKGANCVLLLHGDSLSDDSGTNKTGIIMTGTAAIDPNEGVFGGGGAMRFNGPGTTLQVPNSDDFTFGTGDFTIDFWMKRDGTQGTAAALVTTGPGGLGYCKIYVSNGSRLQVEVGQTTISPVAATNINDLTWTHVALVRAGTALRLFINGTLAGSATMSSSNNVASTGLWMSSPDIGQTSLGYNGWIDEFRVQKGVAQWTANFTPPIYPYDDEDVVPMATGKYVRFRVYGVKTAGNSMQFSELALYRQGVQQTWAGATAWSGVAGITTASSEGPEKAIDGSTATNSKFNDQSFSANGESQLIIYNESGFEFNSYSWWTANDTVGRDPASWHLEVSDDGVTWKTCHSVSSFSATATRNAVAGTWAVGEPEELSRPVSIAVSQAQAATINLPAAAKPGDLAIFFDRPMQNGVLPTPSANPVSQGWLEIARDVWIQNGSSLNQMHNWYAKILTPSDIGAPVQGYTSGTNRKQIAVFRAGRGTFKTLASIGGGMAAGSTGAISGQSIAASAAGEPSITIAGYGGDAATTLLMSPDAGFNAQDVYGAMAALKWLIQGADPVDATGIGMADVGGSNMVTGFWVRGNERELRSIPFTAANNVFPTGNTIAIGAGELGATRFTGTGADTFLARFQHANIEQRSSQPIFVHFEAKQVSGTGSISVDYADGTGITVVPTTRWQTFEVMVVAGPDAAFLDLYLPNAGVVDIRNLVIGV